LEFHEIGWKGLGDGGKEVEETLAESKRVNVA
jgi:hypothetical protein